MTTTPTPENGYNGLYRAPSLAEKALAEKIERDRAEKDAAKFVNLMEGKSAEGTPPKPLTPEQIKIFDFGQLRASVRAGRLSEKSYAAERQRRFSKETALRVAPPEMEEYGSWKAALEADTIAPGDMWKKIIAHWRTRTGFTDAQIEDIWRRELKVTEEEYERDKRIGKKVAEREEFLEATRKAERNLLARSAGVERPRVQNLGELLKKPIPAIEWVVERYLEQGTNHVLYAEEKVGKSTFLSNLMRSVVDRTDFLGHYGIPARADGKPERILYIQPELTEPQLIRYIGEQGINNPGDIEVLVTTTANDQFDVVDAHARAEWVREFSGLGITTIIDDGLRAHLDGLGMDEDREASLYLTAMQTFKAAIGADTMVITHHTGKNGDIRGSSRIRQWADAWTFLQRDRGLDAEDNRTYFEAVGRDVDILAVPLEYDLESRHLYQAAPVDAEGAAELRVEQQEEMRTRREVLETIHDLTDDGKVIHRTSIWEATEGISRSKIAEALDTLLTEGKIEVDPTGGGKGVRYRLASPEWAEDDAVSERAVAKTAETFAGYAKLPAASKTHLHDVVALLLSDAECRPVEWAEKVAAGDGEVRAEVIEFLFTVKREA